MEKFNFSITAHVGNDMMCIYSQDFYFNFMDYNGKRPVIAMINGIIGFRDWVFDDGNDIKGTTYCQYASYNDDNHANYLLAVWCEVDENGCMKL